MQRQSHAIKFINNLLMKIKTNPRVVHRRATNPRQKPIRGKLYREKKCKIRRLILRISFYLIFGQLKSILGKI